MVGAEYLGLRQLATWMNVSRRPGCCSEAAEVTEAGREAGVLAAGGGVKVRAQSSSTHDMMDRKMKQPSSWGQWYLYCA